MKDLSIIITSFNTKDLIKNCIKSVNKTVKKLDYEIIVVDNASVDKSVEEVKNIGDKRIKLIENKKNVGFSKANNQGIKKSRGRYVLLLNSDTLVKEKVLDEMIAWMDKNKDVGIASCALENKDGSLQGTGGYFPTLFKVFAWMTFLDDLPILDKLIKPFHPTHPHFILNKNTAFYKKEKEIDWLTGAFMMIRREVIEVVGYLDEDYFMYTEDTDYCYRAKLAGWKIYYLPRWSIVHLGGASSTQEFPLIKEYEGVKLFYKKHMPVISYPILRLLLKMGATLRIMVFGILKGREVAGVYVKACKIA